MFMPLIIHELSEMRIACLQLWKRMLYSDYGDKLHNKMKNGGKIHE